jgi:hypothetical protein
VVSDAERRTRDKTGSTVATAAYESCTCKLSSTSDFDANAAADATVALDVVRARTFNTTLTMHGTTSGDRKNETQHWNHNESAYVIRD